MGKAKPSNYRIIYHPNGWVESWWLVPDTSYSAQFYEEIFTDNRVSEEVISRIACLRGKVDCHGNSCGRIPSSYKPGHSKLEEEKGGFNEAGFCAAIH